MVVEAAAAAVVAEEPGSERVTKMSIRQAVVADISDMHRVRMSVRENMLSDSRRVTPEMYREHLNEVGRGWVHEQDGRIVGFAVANLESCSVWALFVDPAWEGRGIGRALLGTLVEWLHAQGTNKVTLCTEPGTRAASFYEVAGWKFKHIDESGEAIYELFLR